MAALLVVASAFFISLYYAVLARQMARHPRCTPGLAMTVSFGAAACFLLPVWLLHRRAESSPPLSGDFFQYLAVAVVASVVARALHLHACAKLGLGRVSVFSALTPAFAVFTGWAFLGEMPSAGALGGIAIVCAAVYALFVTEQPGASVAARALSPARELFRSWPMACAFLASAPPALSLVFQKRSVLELDPVGYSLFAAAGIAALGGIVETAMGMTSPKEGGRPPIAPLFAAGSLLATSQVLSSAALRMEVTATVASLARTSIVFQIFLGYSFLGERTDIKRKIAVAAFILLGAFVTAAAPGAR